MKLNNQRGLSLVEILGSIVIIGIILTMLGTIVLQASRNTRDNELSDRAVNLSRNLAEELKYVVRNIKLQGSASTLPTSQQLRIGDTDNEVALIVNLEKLWNTEGYKETIPFPDNENLQYTIEVELTKVSSDSHIVIANPRPTANKPASVSINTYSDFRKAVITATSKVTGRSYQLETLIDY